MRSSVAFWVWLFAQGALAAPTISPEFSVVASPVSGPAFNEQRNVAVASGGGVFLAVWYDLRSDRGAQLYAARLSTAGVALDSAAIRLTNLGAGKLDTARPVVSFNGTNFLVAYGATSAANHTQVLAQRISPTGALLDATPIVLLVEASNQYAVSATSDGTNWLVAFYGGTTVKAVRLSGAGAVLDPAGIALPVTTTSVVARYNGTDYVLAGPQKLARVTTAGTVRDPAGIAWASIADDMACEQGNCLLTWGSGNKVYGVRFASNGTVLDAAGVALVTLPVTKTADSAAIAFTGAGYTVSWHEFSNSAFGEQVRAARVTTSLTASGAAFDVWTTPQKVGPQAIATDGTSSLVIWPAFTQFQENRAELIGQSLGASGGPLATTPFLVSVGASSQVAPAVAFDGVNALVVWQDTRFGTQEDIYAGRVSPTGALLDPAGVAIANTPEIEREPTVAFDGVNYLVAWATWSSGLWARRVNTAGQPLGAAFQLADAFTASKNYPAAAFDGTNLQLAWEFGDDINLKRVSPSGVALDPNPIALATGSPYQYSPAISCGATNCLVVWNESGSSIDVIHAVRVSPAGTVLDAMPIFIGPNNGYTDPHPRVAFDGTNYLVTWMAGSVRAARVSTAGVVLDPSPRILGTSSSSGAAVVWEGSRYFVAWLEFSSFTSSDLYGNWLDTGAMLLDPAATQLSSGGAQTAAPAVASIGGGKLLLTYSLFDEGPQFHAWRVRARLVARSLPDGGTLFDAGTPPDAGTTVDAGPGVDAGTPDSGTVADAGKPDAGIPDAGQPPADAGSVLDAGGEVDAGAGEDAGEAVDAGTPDAGVDGAGGGGEPMPAAGCGCTETGSGWLGLFLLAALIVTRRRASVAR